MRSKHRVLVSAPIPSQVPPEVVLAHIQTFTPLLKHNAVFTSFSEIPPDTARVHSEPFFGPPNSSVRSFLCNQRLELVAGLAQNETWPITFLKIHNGVRARVDARASVTVWIECLVRQAQDPGTPSSNGTLTEEWELFEEVVVESHGLLMPFVSRMTEVAHTGICQRIMDDIVENKYNGKV
ncbi:hypothetical protein NW752_003458 [Fusarium irregulare]|uniref:DUF7053 domain-containing protein n=1 Tax=Fusarium irregulare TaxID=2494466 RepID=A0A9W8PS71_9HYPO|nr:hypothetical protein NW766_004528 [Fusarium irregulare]KAJ4023001.1 hypothetical protein NW752_003458 [Fusarium irregulare]